MVNFHPKGKGLQIFWADFLLSKSYLGKFMQIPSWKYSIRTSQQMRFFPVDGFINTAARWCPQSSICLFISRWLYSSNREEASWLVRANDDAGGYCQQESQQA